MDHEFHPRTYTLAVMSVMFFVGIVATAYMDMNVCPYNRQGGSDAIAGKEKPPTSIFATTFKVFPCHMVDLLVWIYVTCLVLFMAYKWVLYKRQGWHWFLLDFCYFHNFVLTMFLIVVLGSVTRVEGDQLFGWAPDGNGFIVGGLRFDVAPVGVAVATLSPSTREYFAFLFFSLFGGSVGALLWAIPMWGNALLFQSSDKMTSVYLHLAPATVQTLLLHAAMRSLAPRKVSTLRATIEKSVSLQHALVTHVAFFLLWQLVYHVLNETRAKQRRNKAAKMAMISGGVVGTHASVQRVTAYTWLMEKPPGGKNGVLYRAVTLLGPGELATKFMFSVVQLGLHVGFLVLGYVPLRLSVHYFDVAPLLVYIAGFLLNTVWNAAKTMDKWIRKLEKGNAKKSDDIDSSSSASAK